MYYYELRILRIIIIVLLFCVEDLARAGEFCLIGALCTVYISHLERVIRVRIGK